MQWTYKQLPIICLLSLCSHCCVCINVVLWEPQTAGTHKWGFPTLAYILTGSHCSPCWPWGLPSLQPVSSSPDAVQRPKEYNKVEGTNQLLKAVPWLSYVSSENKHTRINKQQSSPVLHGSMPTRVRATTQSNNNEPLMFLALHGSAKRIDVSVHAQL